MWQAECLSSCRRRSSCSLSTIVLADVYGVQSKAIVLADVSTIVPRKCSCARKSFVLMWQAECLSSGRRRSSCSLSTIVLADVYGAQPKAIVLADVSTIVLRKWLRGIPSSRCPVQLWWGKIVSGVGFGLAGWLVLSESDRKQAPRDHHVSCRFVVRGGQVPRDQHVGYRRCRHRHRTRTRTRTRESDWKQTLRHQVVVRPVLRPFHGYRPVASL